MRISDWSSDVCSSDLAVTIHEGVERRQNFGSVSNAYARVLDDADGKELARFDLSEDGSANTSLIFVELYRGPQGAIQVKAIGERWASDLSGHAGTIGVTTGSDPNRTQTVREKDGH